VLLLSGVGSLLGGLVNAVVGLARTEFANAGAGVVGVLLGGALTSVAYFTRPHSLRRHSD
jgi:hypothetical protein